MLTEPPLSRPDLITATAVGFGLTLRSLTFLPLGADARSCSYEGLAEDGQRYYLKLRGDGEQPELLSAVLHIVSQVEGAIAPVPSLNGGGWVQFGAFWLMVFPFVEGGDGWNLRLTPSQWHQVGRTVRSLHDLVLPGPVADLLPRERFSRQWRDQARVYLTRERPAVANDAPAQALEKLLQANRDLLFGILLQAEDLAAELSGRQHEVVCCHGDLHSGNFLVSESGTAHPVDWDNLSLGAGQRRSPPILPA